MKNQIKDIVTLRMIFPWAFSHIIAKLILHLLIAFLSLNSHGVVITDALPQTFEHFYKNACDLDLNIQKLWNDYRMTYELIEELRAERLLKTRPQDKAELHTKIVNETYNLKVTMNEFSKNLSFYILLCQRKIFNVSSFFDSSYPFSPYLKRNFSVVIYDTSLEIFRRSKISMIQDLMKAYDQKFQGRSAPVFQIYGLGDQSPVNLHAGFHRGTRSLFIDMERIGGENFLFYFIHEIFHLVDQKLEFAVKTIESQKLTQQAIAQVKTQNDEEFWSPETQNGIDQWLKLSFDRSMYAEYRAFLFNAKVYHSGLTEGLWSHVNLIEEMFMHSKSPDFQSPIVSAVNMFEDQVFQFIRTHSEFSPQSFFLHPRLKSKVEKYLSQKPKENF